MTRTMPDAPNTPGDGVDAACGHPSAMTGAWRDSLMTAVVYGKPQGQGSKRIGLSPSGKPIPLDASKKTRPWRNSLTAEMLLTAPEQPHNAPMKVTLRIFVPRPQAHYRVGRNAGQLKPNLPSRPPSGGDCDKIARSCGDAGNRVWWSDDARIVWWDIQRLWADGPERIEISAEVLA